MSYKKLGKYIKLIDNRNRDLSDAPLLGVSVQKRFITSIANTIGSDMSKYKLIEKNNFVYIADTSRRGDKIGIALLKDFDKAMISQAYTSFKIIDENELSPDYLMMWFSRPEFDRYARYHSIGSVREVFDWKDMCEVELPIPTIEEQRQIVAQYESITNKIKVNEQICEKLEATAQALYKHWFVDFEFPNEEGKPYKSSDGKMVWNKELGKEIPEGWGIQSFTQLCKIGGGGTPKTEVEEYWDNGKVPFYSPGDKGKLLYTFETEKHITELGLKKCSSKLYPINTTFITARGATTGGISIAGAPMAMNQTCYAILSLLEKPLYTYFLTKSIIEQIKSQAVGATFEAVTTKNFDESTIISPTFNIIDRFEKSIESIFNQILNINKQNQKLTQLQSLLLSRLSVGEEVSA